MRLAHREATMAGVSHVWFESMPVPILDTDRIRLRPYRADDRDGLFELFGDPLVARYWSFPTWTDVAQAVEFLAPLLGPEADDPTTQRWVIADRASDAFAGNTTLFSLHPDQHRTEIGFALLRRHWGLGIAREAVSRVISHGFDELGLRRIEADIDPRNAPSIALVERLGFQREGHLRERWVVAGQVCDSAIFGLLQRDFRR